MKTVHQIKKTRKKLENIFWEELAESPGWRERLPRALAYALDRTGKLINPAHINPHIQIPLKDTYKVSAAKLAGNEKILKEGKPVPMWDGSEEPMVIECTDVFPQHWSRSGKCGFFTVTLDVHEGSAAGASQRMVVPGWLLSKLTAQVSGRKYSHPFPYDMAGMIYTAYLEKDKNGTCMILEMASRDSEISYNRDLMKSRRKGCIKHLYDDCDYCELGRQSCSMAYHTRDFVWQRCIHPACRKPGWAGPHGLCIDCIRKGRFIPDNSNQKGKS